MTTIAYRDGVMAADSQVTSGNRKLRTSKARRLKGGGLIGGTGNLAHVLKLFRWADGGLRRGNKPEFPDGGADAECLLVKADGTVWLLDEELEPMQFEDPFLAIGSGGPYAMAAMECGRTPEEAVEVAAKFDAATSGPVQVWRLDPVTKKPVRRNKDGSLNKGDVRRVIRKVIAQRRGK